VNTVLLSSNITVATCAKKGADEKVRPCFVLVARKTLYIKFMDATNGSRKYCFRFCQHTSVCTVTRALLGRMDFSPRAEAGSFLSGVAQVGFWSQGCVITMAAPKSNYECKM
jgi:hypothetical protein